MGSLGAWTDGAEVALPGGLVVDGRVEQRAVFRRLTGQIERAFHEWLGSAGAVNPARAVSEVLGGVLDRIGAEPADASAAAACASPTGTISCSGCRSCSPGTASGFVRRAPGAACRSTSGCRAPSCP